MKKPYKNHPLILGFGIILLCLLLSNLGKGDELVITEHQVTSSSLFETTPTLGNDGISDLVVYTVRELLSDGFFDQGDIWYQRLVDGAPSGAPVQVTSDLTDDQLNDVHGDYIVYTAYDDVDLSSGNIMLYQISTGTLQSIGYANIIREARIHGNTVVWVQGSIWSEVMIYDLSWLGSSQVAQPLTGPVPPTSNVDIGDRYVVWVEWDGDYDIGAHDLNTGMRLLLTDTPGIHERHPSTSGDWIVWESQDASATSKRIEAINLVTEDFRTIIDDGSAASRPSIDGDLIAYWTDSTGNWDVFVYRISTGETFPVTSQSDDQYLNDVFGDLVAYVDMRTGDEEIYVSKLLFFSCYPELPAPELIVTRKEDYIVNEQEYTRYWLSVTNWSEFPDELFAAAPDLTPPNYARTRVDVYDQDDTRLQGFSNLSGPEQLTAIWFAIPKGAEPPESVYITLTDRRCDITYTSNYASMPIGEEAVEVLNQTIEAINGLASDVFGNPNLQNALTNKINAVLEKIEQGLYQEALDKLEHDILAKTDGCANSGAPDMNDWIVDCEAQNLVYPLIIEAISLLGD